MALYWVIFIISFFVPDCMALKKDVILTREYVLSDMLPKTGNTNYIETKHCDSRIQCAAVCVFCAGILYNRMTGTCHLLKALLSDKSSDRSRKDTGWELYINLNVCESGWQLYNAHCYINIQKKVTWTEARDYCSSVGAYLSRIETKDENDWIVDIILPAMNQEICVAFPWLCCETWIGANDRDMEGEFQWTNKENLQYENWIPGEPSDHNGSEDCVRICDNGLWNDVRCDRSSNIICEKDL